MEILEAEKAFREIRSVSKVIDREVYWNQIFTSPTLYRVDFTADFCITLHCFLAGQRFLRGHFFCITRIVYQNY